MGMKMLRRLSLPLCLLLLSAAVCACAPAAQAPAERTLFVMDTYAQLAAYGAGAEDALQACADELYRLEELFSATREASDVSRLNAAGGAPVLVAADTAALLRRARDLSALTGGAFDPTVYPLMRLWGFGGDPAVPEDEAIAALLPLVGAERIELGADGTARLPAGMGVDLGGIAKGYAADRLAALLRGAGVEKRPADAGRERLRPRRKAGRHGLAHRRARPGGRAGVCRRGGGARARGHHLRRLPALL